MTQDLTGGYCPKCDTVWASPGVCKCDVSYANTKDGMHETGKQLNIAPYNLGCLCDECNKAFNKVLNQIDSDDESSVFEKEIWNAAIEAAALSCKPKDCVDNNSEWSRGFIYAANNTALMNADAIRRLKK